MSDPTYMFASGNQQIPAVASTANGALVVWADDRHYDIVGTRLGPSGQVLDSAGIDFTPDRSGQDHPDVAWNGTNYLLVWSDARSANANDIYGALVSPSGDVLGRFGITTAPRWQDDPAVAWDGSSFLVVWDVRATRTAQPVDVRAARVDGNGRVLDPEGIPIATGSATSPAVESDGAGFLVVWEDGRGGDPDIRGARIQADGSDLDPDGFQVATGSHHQQYPAIAWSGSDYLVAWRDTATFSLDGIYAARVTPDAQVLDPAGILISTSEHTQYIPDVEWNGSAFFVAWSRAVNGSDNDDLYGSRVAPSGEVIDPGGSQLTSSSQYEQSPVLARLGSGVWMAWMDDRNRDSAGYQHYDVYGETIGQDGGVSAEELVSWGPSPQSAPAIAWNGSEYLVAWLDYRTDQDDGDLYVGRISDTGEILDGTGILVSGAPGWLGAPRVASDGSDFLVTWAEGSPARVRGARITGSGVVLDPGGFPLASSSMPSADPSVVWDGTTYMVAWDAWAGSIPGVYGARVTSDGVVIDDPPFAIANHGWDEFSPSVAWDGTHFLVTWEDSRASVDHIYGARVSAEGTVLDPDGFQVSHGPGESDESVVYGGGEYFAAWLNEDENVQGARVTTDGVVLDNAIGIATWPAWALALGWDGSSFVAAWASQGYGNDDVLSARIALDGRVLDPAGISTLTSTNLDEDPAVTSGPAGRVGIAFSSLDRYSRVGRIYARFADEG